MVSRSVEAISTLLSTIREQAVRREAAIQGTGTNRGEVGCRFEQNVAMLVTCRIVCRGPRQIHVLRLLLRLRKLRSLKHLTIVQDRPQLRHPKCVALNAKNDSRGVNIAAGIVGRLLSMEESDDATNCDYACKFCHALSSHCDRSGKSL